MKYIAKIDYLQVNPDHGYIILDKHQQLINFSTSQF